MRNKQIKEVAAARTSRIWLLRTGSVGSGGRGDDVIDMKFHWAGARSGQEGVYHLD